jgi:putative resolvase
LPVPAERVGWLILVRATPAGEGLAGGVVIYARMSSLISAPFWIAR